MIPSRRFLFLAALGLVPAALTVLAPVFFLAALAYLAACCALMAGGYLLGARPADLQVSRSLAPRLSLGEREPVHIVVRSYSRFPLRIAIMDTAPPGWESDGIPLEGSVRPHQEARLAYTVTPGTRGRHVFGDLYLRLEHWPWLAVRQVRIPAAQEVRVYPDLRELSRYELMARRSRLVDLGIHRSRLVGRGTEFERIREYSPDDEYRSVDWKATARRHRPMSRVYEVERSQNLLVVLDAGRMMAGRIGRHSKLDYSVNAALMLGHVALRSGDRFGVMIVSDSLDAYLPPGKGQAHFKRATELLYGVEARLCHVDYRGALEQIAIRCKRRSLVVFFTDLVDEDTAAELVSYLRLLRPVHLPLCVTLQDPNVVAASRSPCGTPAQLYERSVAIELLAERRRVLDQLLRLGASILDSPHEALAVNVVNRYLELKSRQLL